MITLATLPKATAQEVFEQVKTHMLTQNEKCKSGDTCLYRHVKEDGTVLKCAAGCLIADEEYKEQMEVGSFEGSGWKNLLADGLVPREHADLIRDLQEIHDLEDVEDWQRCLEKYAIRNNL
jgi:hypothetical protein